MSYPNSPSSSHPEIETDLSSDLYSMSDLSSIPDTDLHDSYQNITNQNDEDNNQYDQLDSMNQTMTQPPLHESITSIYQSSPPPVNYHTHTSYSSYLPYSLTDQFYHNISLSPLGETDPNKQFFNEINQLIDQKFSSSVEQFNNYVEPSAISHIELKEHLGKSSTSCKIVNFKHHLEEVKNIMKGSYLALLESEKDVLEEISKLEKMKTLSHQLTDFYHLLDNQNIQDKFRDITLEACDTKINNPAFQDKLYVYRHFLEKHRNNIKYLKDLNLLNNNPQCPLCFENSINYVSIPCGHTFCKSCLDKCDRCGVCRAEIKSIQQIYIL